VCGKKIKKGRPKLKVGGGFFRAHMYAYNEFLKIYKVLGLL
jgi:hypothetical protein